MEYPPAHGRLDYDYILDLLVSGRITDPLRGEIFISIVNSSFKNAVMSAAISPLGHLEMHAK